MKVKEIKKAITLINKVRSNKSNTDFIRLQCLKNRLHILYKNQGIIQVHIDNNDSPDFDVYTYTGLLKFVSSLNSSDVTIKVDSSSGVLVSTNNGNKYFECVECTESSIDIPEDFYHTTHFGIEIDVSKVKRLHHIIKSASDAYRMRYELAGLYVGNPNFICATDGYSLGCFGEPDGDFYLNMVIPYSTLKSFKSVNYQLFVNNVDKYGYHIVKGNNFIYKCNNMDTSYPAPAIKTIIVDQVADCNPDDIIVGRKDLLEIVNNAIPFVSSDSYRYSNGYNQCFLLASNKKLEVFVDEGDGKNKLFSKTIPVIIASDIKQVRGSSRPKTINKIKQPGCLMSFNAQYLKDMLETLQGVTLSISQHPSNGCIYIKESDLLYTLMAIAI